MGCVKNIIECRNVINSIINRVRYAKTNIKAENTLRNLKKFFETVILMHAYNYVFFRGTKNLGITIQLARVQRYTEYRYT